MTCCCCRQVRRAAQGRGRPDAAHPQHHPEHPDGERRHGHGDEARLAIALAQEGGLGFIHKALPIEQQAEEVDKVKKSESGMIIDPITISPDARIADALDLMKKYRISGVPVTKGQKLVGILTNRTSGSRRGRTSRSPK